MREPESNIGFLESKYYKYLNPIDILKENILLNYPG
jgi:hypothetical protein